MARRPSKAPEGRPTQFFDLRKADGSRLNVADLVSGQGAADISITATPMWMLEGRPLPGVDLRQLPVIDEQLERFLGSKPDEQLIDAVLQAIQDYIINRAVEIDGANETGVASAVAEIAAAVRQLKALLDNSAHRPEVSAAWRRIDGVRAPFGDAGEPTHDTAYPGLSRLTARLIALEAAEGLPAGKPSADSFRILIQNLSIVLSAAGREPTPSNDDSAGKRSAFESLVVACLDAAQLPPPFEKMPFTDAALKKRVERALSDR